jgi:hypothetical protein
MDYDYEEPEMPTYEELLALIEGELGYNFP